MTAQIEGVEISPKVFAKAIDQLITDRALRRRLESDPVDALKSIGITIANADRAKLTGKRLSEVISAEAPGGIRGLGQVAETYVHVGVDVGVSVVVGVAVGSVVEEVQQEIMRTNLVRIQQAAKARFRE